MILLLPFLGLAVIIWVAGAKLTKEVDILSEKTGLGRGFLGVFLLGLITSLPELLSTSVAGYIGNSDLAVGNIYGSNIFNLSMLVWAELFYRREKSALAVSLEIADISAMIGAIFMISILSLGLFLCHYGMAFRILGLPAVDWIIAFFYFSLGYQMWKKEREDENEKLESTDFNKFDLIKIAILSAIIVVCGIAISIVCDKISLLEVGGAKLGGTLVGGILLGMATSLPEMSVSISAVRMGSVSMAVGNVFGSNMFNILIIPIADVFAKGRLICGVGEMHLFSYAIVVVMSCIFLLSFLFGFKKRIGFLSLTSYGLLFFYGLWMVSLYLMR